MNIGYGIATYDGGICQTCVYQACLPGGILPGVMVIHRIFYAVAYNRAVQRATDTEPASIWDVPIAVFVGLLGIIGNRWAKGREGKQRYPRCGNCHLSMPPLLYAGLASPVIPEVFGGAMYLFFVNCFYLPFGRGGPSRSCMSNTKRNFREGALSEIYVMLVGIIAVLPSVYLASR